MYFCERDLVLIRAATFDEDARVVFDYFRGCLVWSDEMVWGLTPDGHADLQLLLRARGVLFHGVEPLGEVELLQCRERWRRAIEQRFDWPGFRRLELSDEARRVLEAGVRGSGA